MSRGRVLWTGNEDFPSEMRLFRSSGVNSRDSFITSFPRSGNTWVRLLLSDYLEQLAGMDTGTKLPIHQDRVIPDIHMSHIDDVDKRVKLEARLIKSHSILTPRFVDTIVYVFRQPHDALTSYWYFHKRYRHLTEITENLTIDEFCLKTLPSWLLNLHAHLHEADRKRIFFVSYEYLHENTARALAGILAFLQIELVYEYVDNAVLHNSFSRLHNAEKKNFDSSKYQNQFFRKGQVGSGVCELSRETVELITDVSDHVYQDALRRQNKCLSEVLACQDCLELIPSREDSAGSV